MRLTEDKIQEIAASVRSGLDRQSAATMAGVTKEQFLEWTLAGQRDITSVYGGLVFAIESAERDLKLELIANVRKSAAGRKWLRKRQHPRKAKAARKIKVNIVIPGGKS